MDNHVGNAHLYWVYVTDLDTGQQIDKSGPYRRMTGVDFVMKSKVEHLADKLGKSPDRLQASYDEDLSNPQYDPNGPK